MPETAILDQRRADRAAPARGDPGVALVLYDRLEAIEQEWRRFEQSADCTAFQAFDWLSLWCEHVGWRTRTRPIIVVGRRQDGEILFILPLAVTPGTVSRLTWLGSDLGDYNAPLLAKDFSALIAPERFVALWQDVRRMLQSNPEHRHDLVELTKMAERVGGQANPFLSLPVGLNPCNAYVADLSETWDAFYESKRSSATRRRDRTKLKRLTEFGAVRFVTPLGCDDIGHTMDVLIEQKVRAFKRMGVPNIFARPGWREFYCAVATSPRTQSLVHVSRLDAGSIFTAINLGLKFGDCYYHVLVSHDDGEASRFGPGVAHLRELMRFAIERGLKHFDFTIGDERYKSEWADHKVPLYDHVAAAGARGLVAMPMVMAHRRFKRFIKQNETIWSLVSRARAAIGSRSAAANVQPSPPIAPT